jgi:hypothetical protein
MNPFNMIYSKYEIPLFPLTARLRDSPCMELLTSDLLSQFQQQGDTGLKQVRRIVDEYLNMLKFSKENMN